MMKNDVLDFWFSEISPSQWWVKDVEFDALIKQRFVALHKKANQCELYEWRTTAEGRLAEILILDQFSRNIYRDKAQAFASDPLALALAQEAVAAGADQEVSNTQRPFFYLPFMHSESLKVHEQALALYTKLGDPSTLDFEQKHKKIIDRFGRYPHRNAILGRPSTNAEIEFLQTPGSSF